MARAARQTREPVSFQGGRMVTAQNRPEARPPGAFRISEKVAHNPGDITHQTRCRLYDGPYLRGRLTVARPWAGPAK